VPSAHFPYHVWNFYISFTVLDTKFYLQYFEAHVQLPSVFIHPTCCINVSVLDTYISVLDKNIFLLNTGCGVPPQPMLASLIQDVSAACQYTNLNGYSVDLFHDPNMFFSKSA